MLIASLIVGYLFALRSEGQLCAEVQINLAYRWVRSASTTESLIILSSGARGTNAFERAMPCAGYSKV
jgi:transposase